MQLKRYVKTSKYDLIDTTKLVPHMECYLVIDRELFSEQIDGTIYSLGDIINMSDTKEGV